MSMCEAAAAEQYTSYARRGHIRLRVERGRERGSIKSAFHLTGLSICSTENRCFQLSPCSTRGRMGGVNARKMATQREKVSNRYSNEMVALESRSGERWECVWRGEEHRQHVGNLKMSHGERVLR